MFSKKNAKLNNVMEINLIPDVKMNLVRAQVVRSRVTTIAILSTVAMGVLVFIVALIAFGLQGVLIDSADKKINAEFQTFRDYNGAKQIISIQNQLSKIDSLHQSKPMTSRLFNLMVSINDGSGDSVQISRLDFDNSTKTISIEGQSRDGYLGAEKFQKAIYNTRLAYTVNEGDAQAEESVPLTDKVVILEAASYRQDVTGAEVLIFNIGFSVDDLMFDYSTDVKLIGPGRKDVTDSTLAIPKEIFVPRATKPKSSLGENN